MATNSIVCHLGEPRKAKPQSLKEYGKLREKIIQQDWVSLSEAEFLNAVTMKGCPFYQSLLNSRDLMELQFERLCWRLQVFVGLDFDVCPVSAKQMVRFFRNLNLEPWAAYHSFSNNPSNGGESYRLLWRVETDMNLTYDESAQALKKMRQISGGLADKFACNPSRFWQGSNSGTLHYQPQSRHLNLKRLLSS